MSRESRAAADQHGIAVARAAAGGPVARCRRWFRPAPLGAAP